MEMVRDAVLYGLAVGMVLAVVRVAIGRGQSW